MESVDAIDYINEDQIPGWDRAHAQDESGICAFCACSKTFSLDAALSLVGSFLVLFWQFSDYWWTEVTWVTLKRVVDKIFNRKHEKQNISKYISRKNAIRVNKHGIHDIYM